jgi:hypothetical protein
MKGKISTEVLLAGWLLSKGVSEHICHLKQNVDFFAQANPHYPTKPGIQTIITRGIEITEGLKH